jgi:hypothetical protein
MGVEASIRAKVLKVDEWANLRSEPAQVRPGWGGSRLPSATVRNGTSRKYRNIGLARPIRLPRLFRRPREKPGVRAETGMARRKCSGP